MTMRTTVALIAVLAVSLLLVPAASQGAEEKVELKLHFEKGQQFTLTTAVEQDMATMWNDEQRDSKNITSITMALDVFSVADDGTAYMKATIKSIALKSDSGRWSYEYDSDNPPDEIPRPAAAFAAMVGEAFMMRLTPTGKVAEFEGVGKMLAEVEGKLGDDERRRRWGAERLSRHFSESALKQTFEGAFGFLPAEAVAVGDSWTRTAGSDHGIPVTAEEKYTLTERKDGTAAITLEATLEPYEDETPRHRTGYEASYEISGTRKGTVSVDEATGCLFKTTMTEKVEGKLTLSGGRGGNAERSMDVKSEATITIETQQPEENAEETPETKETTQTEEAPEDE
jgi:hypothetical protein